MLDLTLLGTAATMPLADRALTAALLSFSGRSVLFDCGEGTQSAARRAHVSLMKTDLIALTHYHGDHIFGLPGLLQTMGCLGRTAPLSITGPEGLEQALAPILALAGPLPFPLTLLPLPEGGISLSELSPLWPKEASLLPFPTKHRVPSCGYRFSLSRPGKFSPEAAAALGVPMPLWGRLQHGESVFLPTGEEVLPSAVLGPPRRGLSVVFSGDTAPCPTLIEASRDADLLICDATYADPSYAPQAELYGHCTFAQAASVAASAGVRRLWLAHFSQILETPEEQLPLASAIFSPAECGKDGQSIRLKFDDRQKGF